MPEPQLPPSIRTFISGYLRSVEELEVLLLLHRERRPWWSVKEVYDTILSNRSSVERCLDELTQHGFLEKIADSTAAYRWCAGEELTAQVATLAELYKTMPVRIIEAIYKPAASAAQSFADAFKLTNPEPPV